MLARDATGNPSNLVIHPINEKQCDVIIMTSDELTNEIEAVTMIIVLQKINCSVDGRLASEAGRTN